MSSRINLAFRPSVSTAVLAALPWLVLALFVTATALTRSLWLLLALVPIGWMAVSRARRLGWLIGRDAVHRIELDHERGRCWLGDGREISVRIHSSSLLTAPVLALKLDANGAMSRPLLALLRIASFEFLRDVDSGVDESQSDDVDYDTSTGALLERTMTGDESEAEILASADDHVVLSLSRRRYIAYLDT